jgi:thiol-disulfide isomerase/thioredoxin
MRGSMKKWGVIGGSLLIVGGALGGDHPGAVPQGPAPTRAQAEAASAEEREVQGLLERLSQLSKAIAADPQGAQTWRNQIAQADVSLHLAMRSKGKERDDWLKMAIDSLFGAAAQSPQNETTARQRLAQLPAQIAKACPDSPVWSYAAMQEVRLDYLRAMAAASDDPSKAQLYLRDRLLRFAHDYPAAAEAPGAIEEAASLSVPLGKKDDAARCYRYLMERYAGTPVAQKAEGAIWRLRTGSETVELNLPRLYPSGEANERPFDLKDLRGKLVLVYFWSSTSPRAEVDLQLLKHLMDKHGSHGLEVVYVNLDKDMVTAQTYMSGRLTVGTHLHASGGMSGGVAKRYGIESLPEVFLLGPDGELMKHSLTAQQAEAEVTAKPPRGR